MLSEVPKGWLKGQVVNFFQLQRGHDLPVQERNLGAVPVMASNGQVGWHDQSPLSGPGVVTGRSGTIGNVSYVQGAYWPLNTTLYVRDFKGSNPEFVYYFLQNFPLKDHQSGTGVPTLNRNDIHAVDVLFPPLGEQQRIAEVLRSVDDAIAAAEAALTAGHAVHRLSLEALFGICFSDRPADDAAAVTIGHVCERVTYGFTNPMPTTEEGPWMLTAANVRHGWIDYQSARHTSVEAYANDITDKSRPPVGAVLVTKDGTLGRVARVDKTNVCINQSVAVLIPNAKAIDGAFLSFLLQCPTGQDRMLADSGGSSVKHIYISKLAELSFAPPPMDVQRERATLAEESERSVREQSRAVEGLCALKAALMSDLLSGRVQVPA